MIEYTITSCYETTSPLSGCRIVSVVGVDPRGMAKTFQTSDLSQAQRLTAGMTFLYNPATQMVTGLPLKISDADRFVVGLD